MVELAQPGDLSGLAGLAELESILGPVDALQLDAIIQAAQALKEKVMPGPRSPQLDRI